MAKHHDRVACLNLGVTTDQLAAFATYQSANGDAEGQSQVFHQFFCYLRAFCCRKLRHFGIDKHQRTQVIDIGLEQHLEDVTGSDGHFINDGADIQFLGHLHVVEVLYHCHSLTDTESLGRQTGENIRRLLSEVIDAQVSLHSLRRIDQEQLLPLLEVALEDEKPQVVMLDGIVEFVASFNDETESKQLIKELLKLSDQHNCAIVCILHTNKADEDHNMRGHLGTMLAQKSATVLECIKEKGSSVITVKCSEARHEEMPEWSISFDAEGHIVDADEQRRQLLEQRKAEQLQKRQEAIDKEKKERLEKCLRILTDNGGVVSRKQLTEIWEMFSSG